MPLLTRNPSHYLFALQEETTEPLHVGLILGEEGAGAHVEVTPVSTDDSSWRELASAIKNTTRSIRCMWLRADGEVSDAALRGLGQELAGAVTVESLVIEGHGIGPDEVTCLREFLENNNTLRGIKFVRTYLDAPSSMLVSNFFSGNPNLRVLDLTANPRVDDETVRGVLDAIMKNDGCRLETLNIIEDQDENEDFKALISESGVDSIAFFLSQSEFRYCSCNIDSMPAHFNCCTLAPSLLTLRLKIIALNDQGLKKLATSIEGECCNITLLDIGEFL